MSLGVNYSSKGLQSVVPTGISTFDRLIGGGFALTSINVIDEDWDRMYSSMLTKAYLSSGIISGHKIIIFSSTIKNKNSRFLKELPSLQSSTGKESQQSMRDDDSMKIAFRYSNLPSRYLNDNDGEDLSNQKLDFGVHLEKDKLEQASIEFYDHSDILNVLHSKTLDQSASKSTTTRILIDEVGSPLSSLPTSQLPSIIHRIKVLMRRLPNDVCLATITPDTSSSQNNESSDLLESILSTTRDRIHSNVDSVTRLIGFNEQSSPESNPYSSDYVGFVHFLCLPRLNSFAPYNATLLESTEYGIKLRNSKRFLTIEKLSLPPDLGETVNRFTSSAKISEGLSCSSNVRNF